MNQVTFHRWIRDLHKLRTLSFPEGMVLVESGATLGLASVALQLLSFKQLSGLLGKQQKDLSDVEPLPQERKELAQIARSIQALQQRIPWHCTCFVQAIAGQWMLRRRGIRCRLSMGVGRDSHAQLQFHAWLRSGTFWITGKNEQDGMEEIFSFVT